ncbi:GAL4-like transcriptional activator [Fusarium heterosporum]|uniref:GAL4-like transcriptional activator n=1 Tax=Fusarium heterosporum TaxID=42747 RepID=A0A8H5WVS4_FUSHE|nr:GAL4-like transcriptional activator [Fusarium heterosporum]
MADAEQHATGRPLRSVSLRVSQVFSACTFCKSRKIKCDGATPACGGCVRFNRRDGCSLSTGASNRAQDYPTFLQQRIRDAQKQLAQAQARRDTLPSPAVQVQSSTHQRPPDLQESSIIDSLIDDIGALPVIACSYPSTTGGPTLSSLVLATASTNQLSSTLHQTQLNETTPCLPQESTALSLAKHYFENVYPRLPFFSIQGFWVQFEHVFSGALAPSEATNPSHPADPISLLSPTAEDLDRSSLSHGYSYFTVLLVLAISASSLSRSADSIISTQAQRLFQNALAFRESAILPNNIVGVQSILFLIQFATLNPSLLDAWYLIGVGMRMCVDLGLHQDPQSLESLEVSLLETRRRLWWSVYSFDRSMSLGCGRPTEISDSAINASLPTFRIETTATAAEIHGYLQRYRALQIQSEIYNSFNQSRVSDACVTRTAYMQLCYKLSEWKDASAQLPTRALVESEWLMGRMLLLRPCKYFPERTMDELSELWHSAVGFIGLYRRLVEANSIFYVQVACEKVYWAGLLALYSFWRLRSSTSQEGHGLQVLNVWLVVKDTMYVLRSLSERWGRGQLLCSSFDSLTTHILEIVGTSTSLDGSLEMPIELRDLDQYTSLTAIWACGGKRENRIGSTSDEANELRKLVSVMT